MPITTETAKSLLQNAAPVRPPTSLSQRGDQRSMGIPAVLGPGHVGMSHAGAFLRSRILSMDTQVTILSSAESPVTELAARYLSTAQLDDLSKPVMERTTALVNGLRNDFIKDGYQVVTKVQRNHVIESIAKQVEAEHADLLVVGSRELTKTDRRYLGSVSESLLKYVPCSVLVVRGVGG